MKRTLPFFEEPEWTSIVDNINGIYTSDGTINTLLDYERVLDEADLYAFQNWPMGELVDGPVENRYTVGCTFMWPYKMMPDPRGAKRLLTIGCTVKFRRVQIEVPVRVDKPSDFKPGTHYPKLIKREVWLVNIVIPRELMNDIREGSLDLADKTIDLSDLDDAYAQDLQKDGAAGSEDQAGGPGGPGAPGGLGALPPLGGGLPPLGGL